jgi:adenylate kinase family enzyme
MKTYKILVLGASGSGKTFFLASMFKRLAIQNNEIGFFLDANPKQKQALVNLFHTIADPHKDWPPEHNAVKYTNGDLFVVLSPSRGILILFLPLLRRLCWRYYYKRR